jgi:hypothetical protein
MAKDKDLKQLVRARMEKTGESYSIARLHMKGAVNAHGGGLAGIAAVSGEDTLETRAAVYRVKITIIDIEPAVWRRVLLPADTTLAEFHEVIQGAFGWWNYHLHQYTVDGQHVGVPDPEYAEELPPMKNEQFVALRDIRGARKIVYEYDFGDSWEHAIEVENVAAPSEPRVAFATCIAGARARPPEDCGGASGYQRLREILANPQHEEYREMKTWVGRKYDPEKFDLAEINRALRKVRRPSDGSRRRVAGRLQQ